MMLESERVLGPRWSLKELRTFYILLKAHGRQWEKLEERLPRRSGAMVRALFEMHRGYLSLPEASVEGFCAIMMDHYESVDDIPQQKYKQEEDNKRPSGQDDMDMSEDVKTENGQEGAPAQRSRKKRRLEKLLDYDQLATLRIRSEGDMQLRRADSGEQNEVLGTLKRLGKKSEAPLKARAWLPRGEESDETGLSKVKGARFDLPWTHWFYSYVDVDFFRHNEFMECLTRMGLGKITAAARPIWSSVRTSMGHPRRLSPLFFAQEKTKLETYRAVKRRFDPSHLPDGTWPYQCPASLHPGAAVIVRIEVQQRFHLGTVVKFDVNEGVCHVFFHGNTEQEVSVACNLDSIMVLDFPPWSGMNQPSNNEPKLAAATLLRRDNNRTSIPPFVPPKPTGSVDIQYREDKLRAVLAVKSLLHRKEQIILALSILNKHVAEQQVHVHEQNAMTSSLWMTPTAFSSAAVKDLAWANSREKALVQRQHAWLSMNLNETNSHLMAALLSLQSLSSTNALDSPGIPSAVYPAEDVTWSDEATLPTDTLSAEQMRWAIDFLSSSQKKAASVVAKSALQVVNDGIAPPTQGASVSEGRRRVLPDTMQLIAKCVTLMSVLHRQGAAAPEVPPVITQKLVERVLELLKPSHEMNMDLYAELRAAAEGVQVQVVTQPSANAND